MTRILIYYFLYYYNMGESIFEELYSLAKWALNEKEGVISITNVINLVTSTMESAERFRDISGPQKKEVVVNVLDKLVEEIPATQDDKPAIQYSIKLLLPNIIDSIVSATKGQLDLNRTLRVSKINPFYYCYSKIS